MNAPLIKFAQNFLPVVMRAEAQWRQRHRRLVADALVARGIEVRHTLSASSAPPTHSRLSRGSTDKTCTTRDWSRTAVPAAGPPWNEMEMDKV
jgi:hypothetical protein